MNLSRIVFGLPLLASLGGCIGITCTTEARAALLVAPVDSITGAPVEVGVEVIATDGAFADTSRTFGTGRNQRRQAALAFEQAGTYDVTVNAPGYAQWVRRGVHVNLDECGHPETVELIAQLQR